MEPQLQTRITGLAPIAGWSSVAPSLEPSPNKASIMSYHTHMSTGLGPDTPIVSISGSSPYSPPYYLHNEIDGHFALPPLTSPTFIDCKGDSPPPYEESDRLDVVSDEDNANNNNQNKSAYHRFLGHPYDDEDPKTNGIVVTENPGYEVKFADNLNDEYDDRDSIISSKCSFTVSITEHKPAIPDGGWGWMVVLASLTISMIADGVSFSFGLLYIELLNEFGASMSKTAWIGSLFMAVPLLSGPVMSALVDRYGCRSMTILGGLISGIGFVISSQVKSIEVMFLTFGVISGLGLGLCYVTAVVSIAYWFDKKRTLAVGLGACGTGIGTFVYAPMTQYLIQEFGWRGTTLLLAGTFFNMCVCGTIMRDPEWWTIEQNKQGSLAGGTKSLNKSSSCGSVSGRSGIDTESAFHDLDEVRKLLKSGEKPEYILQNLATTMVPPKDTSEDLQKEQHFHSVVNLPTFVRQSEKVPLEVLQQLSANKRLYNVILENYPSLLSCRSMSDQGLNKIVAEAAAAATRVPVTMSLRLKESKPSKYLPNQNSVPEEDEVPPSEAPLLPDQMKSCHVSPNQPHYPIAPVLPRTDSMPWIRRQFSTNAHYLKHLRVHRNSVMYRGAMLNIRKYRLRASSCPDIYRNSMTTLAKETEEKWYDEGLELVRGMMDFSMFLELHFLLMSLSTIILFIWFIIPYFYLAENLSRNHGFTETEASNIISIIGIANTIGMVGLGWAGDQPWMNIMKTYAVCLVLCGISTLGMIFSSDNYPLLVLSAVLFGLFFASSFSFTPVILVELVPLERFTTAYGLILLCQGIGSLIGPPLAGFLYDVTGTWQMSFIQAGLWIVVSGILIGIIPFTKNRKIWGEGPLENEKVSEKGSDFA